MGKGDLLAHSVNPEGDRHRLDDHLRGTAALARKFGEPLGVPDLAEYLALVHDVGKGSCAWQQGLLSAEATGRRVGLDHKFAGVWLARRAAQEFVLCIQGHHGGLGARESLMNRLRSASDDEKKEWEETIARVEALVPEINPDPWGSLVPSWAMQARREKLTDSDLLARLVFSALVDADFLDTEAHFQGAVRPLDTLAIGDLADRYEERRVSLLAQGSRGSAEVDAWRAKVYEQAIEAAAKPQGIFRFGSPTGSGKTIATGGFAVRHAAVHGLRRVIVAVPFISITEQNAGVYRDLLYEPGGTVVLEHHSGADLDEDDAPGGRWRKLAAENWDAPFVVTTTAQLFQSLFDRRPSAMRKLHRLAGSVIVLDEVQALPDRLLLPILSALRVLTERFGATVLLASATQPAYWNLEPFQDLQIHDVIPDREALYSQFRRVRYQWRLDPPPEFGQIAAEIAGQRQVLAVVNTTADSARLHRSVAEQRDQGFGTVLHLSTRMTAEHRRKILAEIRRRLAEDEPVAVVSTQLIEAGVDVDFPVVYRAWAPADSLQQAAGRANRNGRLSEGKVVVFRLADAGQPGDSSYKAALAATEMFFGPGPDRVDPDHLDVLKQYYRERFGRQNINTSGDGFEIENLRTDMDFPEVAEKFRLIDERTVPVAVLYDPDDEDLRAAFEDITARLRSSHPAAAGQKRQLMRELGPFLATIPKSVARTALKRGDVDPLIGDVLEWTARYDRDRGIDLTELAELRSKEVFIF